MLGHHLESIPVFIPSILFVKLLCYRDINKVTPVVKHWWGQTQTWRYSHTYVNVHNGLLSGFLYQICSHGFGWFKVIVDHTYPWWHAVGLNPESRITEKQTSYQAMLTYKSYETKKNTNIPWLGWLFPFYPHKNIGLLEWMTFFRKHALRYLQCSEIF